MATTFLKRQKEMKRLEKQREKAERRAQKKLAKRTGNDDSPENIDSADNDVSSANAAMPSEPEPQS
ncbi:MAG: hypothetical protein ABSE45_12460 [Candidatus Acidiferrales bacterium]|jgi:hypothetical protein